MNHISLVSFALRCRDAILTRVWNVFGHGLLRIKGVEAAKSVKMYGLPIISRAENSIISVGAHVVLCSHSRFTALGVVRPVVIRTLRPQARIRIGENAGISGSVICAAKSVDIGADCLLGSGVQITDTDFHALRAPGRRFNNDPQQIESAPVVIEDNVFLGSGVMVLKGVRIGRNTVVGAGSVVTRSLPADVIAAGVPARVLKPLPAAEPAT